jgi:hypothetical protein
MSRITNLSSLRTPDPCPAGDSESPDGVVDPFELLGDMWLSIFRIDSIGIRSGR